MAERRVGLVALLLFAGGVLWFAGGVVEPSRAAGVAETATPTATMWPTELRIYGIVYDAELGPEWPVGGATVRVQLNVPHAPFSATTDADGTYRLTVPALYAEQTQMLSATAPGYYAWEVYVSANDLRYQPRWDIGLVHLPQAFLPLVSK